MLQDTITTRETTSRCLNAALVTAQSSDGEANACRLIALSLILDVRLKVVTNEMGSHLLGMYLLNNQNQTSSTISSHATYIPQKTEVFI
jgi:hypothetical protein